VLSVRSRFDDAAGEQDVTPLAVLFALNAVDELDQVTFGVVAPEIRDTFGVSETTITSIAAAAAALVIMLVVPIGVLADRHNRVRMTLLAATAWGTMTIGTGLSGYTGVLGLLVLARIGAGLGRVMNEPVHASLLADYYAPVNHGRVFSLHRMASPIGLMLVLGCGALADVVGWRLGFVLLALPTLVTLLFVSRLREPSRGASINSALALRAAERGEKVPFGEAFRRLRAIPTLRRSWVAAFFIGAGLVPIAVFFNFFFEHVYDIESTSVRGAILTLYGAGSFVGLQIGSRLSTRTIMAGDVPRLAVLAGGTLVTVGVALFGMAVSPWLGLSIAFVFAVGVTGAGFPSYSLPIGAAVAPPRLRSQAFGWFVFFVGLGAIVVTPIVSGVGEEQGYRFAIAILSALFVVAGLVYASCRRFVRADAEQAYASLVQDAGAS
jgi:branched-chain amino acid transport system ATP-binding protein